MALVSWTSLATERVGEEGRKLSISAEERSFLENLASKSDRAAVAALLAVEATHGGGGQLLLGFHRVRG